MTSAGHSVTRRTRRRGHGEVYYLVMMRDATLCDCTSMLRLVARAAEPDGGAAAGDVVTGKHVATDDGRRAFARATRDLDFVGGHYRKCKVQ